MTKWKLWTWTWIESTQLSDPFQASNCSGMLGSAGEAVPCAESSKMCPDSQLYSGRLWDICRNWGSPGPCFNHSIWRCVQVEVLSYFYVCETLVTAWPCLPLKCYQDASITQELNSGRWRWRLAKLWCIDYQFSCCLRNRSSHHFSFDSISLSLILRVFFEHCGSSGISPCSRGYVPHKESSPGLESPLQDFTVLTSASFSEMSFLHKVLWIQVLVSGMAVMLCSTLDFRVYNGIYPGGLIKWVQLLNWEYRDDTLRKYRSLVLAIVEIGKLHWHLGVI